jgi:pilus assembly protein Flp/PilA
MPVCIHPIVTFLENEDGPTTVEYAIMVALIIVICISAVTTLGSNSNQTFTTTGKAIRLGSASSWVDTAAV